MPTLSLAKNNRMFISNISQIESLQGYYRKDESYSFPICGDIIRRLLLSVPGLLLDPLLQAAISKILVSQKETIRIREQEDCDGDPNLYPYQRIGVAWLKRVKRAILADDVGLGKTLVSLVAAREVKPKRTLIICSKVKRKDWAEHVEKWMKSPFMVALNNHDWNVWPGVLITNYDTAVSHMDHLRKANLVIVDECHKIRNRKTQVWKAIKQICRGPEYVFLLTASPTVNSASDLWTLLNICDPKRFGSYWGMAFRFYEIIQEFMGIKVGSIRKEEEENFKRILTPYVLSRSDKLDLPIPKYHTINYELSGEQERIYNEMNRTGITTYEGRTVEALLQLSQTTRLIQIAISPYMIFPQYIGPSKLDLLPEIVGDKKVLIFSRFAEIIKLLPGYLSSCVTLTGDLNEAKRQKSISSFKQGEAQVLGLTYGIGGESLDLAEASGVILLDYPWHTAGMNQAIGRILRHGQKAEKVEVISIYAGQTIEKHIRDIVQEKKRVTIKEILRRST